MQSDLSAPTDWILRHINKLIYLFNNDIVIGLSTSLHNVPVYICRIDNSES